MAVNNVSKELTFHKHLKQSNAGVTTEEIPRLEDMMDVMEEIDEWVFCTDNRRQVALTTGNVTFTLPVPSP
eukprot:SAG31_NODE_643_length_13291_cov_6.294042_12_plen_71_part_00